MKSILLKATILTALFAASSAFAQAPPSVSQGGTEAADKSNCPSGTCYNRVDNGAVGVMAPSITQQVMDSLDNGKTPKELTAPDTVQ